MIVLVSKHSCSCRTTLYLCVVLTCVCSDLPFQARRNFKQCLYHGYWVLGTALVCKVLLCPTHVTWTVNSDVLIVCMTYMILRTHTSEKEQNCWAHIYLCLAMDIILDTQLMKDNHLGCNFEWKSTILKFV